MKTQMMLNEEALRKRNEEFIPWGMDKVSRLNSLGIFLLDLMEFEKRDDCEITHQVCFGDEGNYLEIKIQARIVKQ